MLSLPDLHQPNPSPLPALMLLAQTSIVLVSWLKPLLLLAPLIGWALMISKVYDKHAARFFLPRRQWNLAHMGVGLAAVVAGIFLGTVIPGEGAFWLGWGVMIVILISGLVAYAVMANRDERVPPEHRIRLNLDTFRQKREEKAKAKLQATVTLAIKAPDPKGKLSVVVEAPQAESPEYAVRTTAEQLVVQATLARASQVDIAPVGKDNQYASSYLVDGVRQPGESLPAAEAIKAIDFWKSAARLDVADRRRKQQGMLSAETGATKTILKLTTLGGAGGPKLTIQFDPEKQVTKKIDELGMLEPQRKELNEIVANAKGVVLVTSPLDGGRTTTMYSLLRMHDAYISNVQTVELDPMAAVEGVRANKFEPQAVEQAVAMDAGTALTHIPGAPAAGAPGGEFSTLVRSILRRDPDVVAVGDLPDAATAKEVTKADHERTRVYMSFRAGDALTAVQAWVKAVGEPRTAANCLHGVIAQRLARRLCTNCRVAYPPSPEMLKQLGVPEGKVPQLFKKGGQVLIKNKPEVCPQCNGSGYYGQTGLFEVYQIGPDERELIATGNFQGLRAAMRKRPLPTLQQVAIRKAVDGITSVEEVTRATSSEGETPPAPARPAAPQPAAVGGKGAGGGGGGGGASNQATVNGV